MKDCVTLTIEDLLHQLSMSMGGAPLRLDASGLCAFNYDDSLDFLIMAPANSEHVYLAASLCPIPVDKVHCYETLLKLNFLLMETAGTTFAIDDEAGMIVLCYERSILSFSVVSFVDVVGSFLTIATRLKTELQTIILAGLGAPRDDVHERAAFIRA